MVAVTGAREASESSVPLPGVSPRGVDSRVYCIYLQTGVAEVRNVCPAAYCTIIYIVDFHFDPAPASRELQSSSLANSAVYAASALSAKSFRQRAARSYMYLLPSVFTLESKMGDGAVVHLRL